jgi:hypothetical protein
MFVRQRVPDYENWRSVFDTMMAPARAAYGLEVTGIYRMVGDANTVMVTLEAADVVRARAFAASAILASGRARALAGDRAPADVWLSEDRMQVT